MVRPIGAGYNAPVRVALRFLLVLLFSLVALAGPERLDPVLRALLQAQGEGGPVALLAPQVLSGLVALGSAPSGEEVRVFLLTRDPGGARAVPSFRPHQVVGNLATGAVRLADLPALADHPQVVFVQASRPVYPSLDRSVPETAAPALWYATPRATGQGVIVGIVDTGIDILHSDFRVDRTGDGFEEGSRILWLWDQAGVGATGFPPWWGDVPSESFYGRVFSRPELEQAIAIGTPPSVDTHGHGTHVAGIAAGDGSAGLRGVAPEAELVVVKTTFYEDTVVDGVRFVFEAAQALGRPAVVNLSLGGHSGSHDGNSLFERMIDALIDRPGRAVVVAAGNEGNRKIHVGAEVREPTTWHIEVEKTTVTLQLWHSGTTSFTTEVRGPGGETVTALPGSGRWASTSSGGVWIDNTSLPDPRTLGRYIYVALTDVAPGSTWALTLTPLLGGGGRVDGWIENPSAAQFREGDTTMTIAEPGNAQRVITVGAYITKTRWTSVSGEQTAEGEVGALASFSSRGPTRDGRVKPDLVAPGAWIASARSRSSSPAPWLTLPGGQYAMLLGTSMAAPHVTGAVALLFSLRPGLTADEVKDALRAGARADSQVGPVPSTAWGAGKLDLPGAAARLGGTTAERPTLVLLSNPVAREAAFRYLCPQGTRSATLQVYDLLGRLLFVQAVAPPSGEVRWALVTRDGRPVASGLYLAVLVTDRGASEPVRVVVGR